MDWSSRECARSGHATFAPDEDNLRHHLTVDTPAGPAWKCLRCGVFVVGEPFAHGGADQAPVVWHGAQVRDRLIIRLLAVERGARGLLVLGLAWVVLQIRGSQDSIEDRVTQSIPLLKPFATEIGWNLLDSKMLHWINVLIKTTPHTLLLIATGLGAYGLLQVIEGVGLWLVHRWAEYLAVVATSAFIPVEIYELNHSVTPVKVGALVVNIGAVIWLLWRKHLFGVNGGMAAIEDEWLRGRAAIARAIRLPAE